MVTMLIFFVHVLNLFINVLDGCEQTICDTVAGFYIDNVQSIGRGSVLLTVTNGSNIFCKRMDIEDAVVSLAEDCALYTDDIENWTDPDTDATATTITAFQNNIGTVTASMTRNSISFDVTNIPFNSTVNASNFNYQYWTVNSLYTTFIRLSDEMFSQNNAIYAIQFSSQTSNTYNIYHVTVDGYSFDETDGNQIYVYHDELQGYPILKVPIICCLCVNYALISYEIDTTNADGIWLMTASVIVYDAVIYAVAEKMVWWDHNCPFTSIDVYDLNMPGMTKQTYTVFLTNSETSEPTVTSPPTRSSVLGVCDNNCISWYDGCNHCFCDITEAEISTACTARWCSITTTSYCKQCVSDQLYWLRTLQGGCTGEFIHCDSRFIGAPCGQGKDRSYCQCPAEYPFFVETSDGGKACIKANDCPELGETLGSLPFEIFEYPRSVTSECDYSYSICYSDNQCEDDLICNIPDDTYSTCVPLFCNLDDNCDLIEDDNCLTNDCMGQGWGYCATNDKLFNPNESAMNLVTLEACIVVASLLLFRL